MRSSYKEVIFPFSEYFITILKLNNFQRMVYVCPLIQLEKYALEDNFYSVHKPMDRRKTPMNWTEKYFKG